MKKDKLKSLLITITSELNKLSREELLRKAAKSKNYSCILWEANLLSFNCFSYSEYYKVRFGSDAHFFYSWDNKATNYENITCDNYDYALAA